MICAGSTGNWATMQERGQVLGSLQLARPWLNFGLTGQNSDKSRSYRSSLENTQKCPCVPAASAPALRSSAWLRGHPCNPQPKFPNDMHILVPTPMSRSSRPAHRFSVMPSSSSNFCTFKAWSSARRASALRKRRSRPCRAPVLSCSIRFYHVLSVVSTSQQRANLQLMQL